MGLTQDFAGLIEPDDEAWSRASSATKRRYYDAAGKLVLDELSKQLGKGIGRNGRAMKARIQPVLDDGADGPVMEPHYDASRVITLADYSVTDRSLKLWWHAGTGHKSHRKARKIGAKAPPFGTILAWHAAGEVPHCPIRDVRLCAGRIRNVKLALRPLWSRIKPAPQRAPEPTPTPPPRQTQPTAPTAATAQSRGQYQRFAERIAAGQHPTPTHPIPVVSAVPKSRVKGPIFVVTGGKGKPPVKAPKVPAPKPIPPVAKPTPVPPVAPVPVPHVVPPKPHVPVPVPKPVPVPTLTPTAPQAFAPRPAPMPALTPVAPETPVAFAVAYGKSMGFEVHTDPKVFAPGSGREQFVAFYSPTKDAVYINTEFRYWKDPGAYLAEVEAKSANWFSSDDPRHAIFHEVGHGLHARGIGIQEFRERPDTFATIADIQTARTVSKYAGRNTAEFVAEVYAARMAGRTFDPPVLALYDQLGGPSVGFTPRGGTPLF